MRIIMVKGFSKTGKTTTVTSLARELKSRGYSVGTVKDIHYEGFQADKPGTDTFKHAEAGARRVTARGGKETAIICGRQMSIHEILKYYKEDFVILEGDCGLKCPAIITGRTVDDVKKRICPEAIAISGVIAGGIAGAGGIDAGSEEAGAADEAFLAASGDETGIEDEALSAADGAAHCHAGAEREETGNPILGISETGGRTARNAKHSDFLLGLSVIDGVTEVKELADLVERKTETQKQDFDVELTIGGEEIWMVPFVRETLKNVVIGAVKALDGYEAGKEIVIKVK